MPPIFLILSRHGSWAGIRPWPNPPARLQVLDEANPTHLATQQVWLNLPMVPTKKYPPSYLGLVWVGLGWVNPTQPYSPILLLYIIKSLLYKAIINPYLELSRLWVNPTQQTAPTQPMGISITWQVQTNLPVGLWVLDEANPTHPRPGQVWVGAVCQAGISCLILSQYSCYHSIRSIYFKISLKFQLIMIQHRHTGQLLL